MNKSKPPNFNNNVWQKYYRKYFFFNYLFHSSEKGKISCTTDSSTEKVRTNELDSFLNLLGCHPENTGTSHLEEDIRFSRVLERKECERLCQHTANQPISQKLSRKFSNKPMD